MRSLFSGLSMAALALVLFTAGCEKEPVNHTTSSGGTEKMLHVSAKPQKLPNITLSTSVGFRCGTINPCGTSVFATTKYNQLSVTNTSQSTYPSLTYTFYVYSGPGAGGTENYAYLSQYTCSLLTTLYATGSFNNGDKVLIFANDPIAAGPGSTPLNYDPVTDAITNYPTILAASTYTLTTMGSYKGLSCNR